MPLDPSATNGPNLPFGLHEFVALLATDLFEGRYFLLAMRAVEQLGAASCEGTTLMYYSERLDHFAKFTGKSNRVIGMRLGQAQNLNTLIVRLVAKRRADVLTPEERLEMLDDAHVCGSKRTSRRRWHEQGSLLGAYKDLHQGRPLSQEKLIPSTKIPLGTFSYAQFLTAGLVNARVGAPGDGGTLSGIEASSP